MTKHTDACMAVIENRWIEQRRGMSISDIADAVGISTMNARRSLAPLLFDGKIESVPIHRPLSRKRHLVYFPSEQYLP